MFMQAINPNYSIKPLVIACWKDAERQARKGDRSARRWLYSQGVLWLDIVLNIHPDHTRRYLDRVLKRRKKAKPNTPIQTRTAGLMPCRAQQDAPGEAKSCYLEEC
jgi:hypothetical protein